MERQAAYRAELYPPIADGCLLEETTVPENWKLAWERADANSWQESELWAMSPTPHNQNDSSDSDLPSH